MHAWLLALAVSTGPLIWSCSSVAALSLTAPLPFCSSVRNQAGYLLGEWPLQCGICITHTHVLIMPNCVADCPEFTTYLLSDDGVGVCGALYQSVELIDGHQLQGPLACVGIWVMMWLPTYKDLAGAVAWQKHRAGVMAFRLALYCSNSTTSSQDRLRASTCARAMMDCSCVCTQYMWPCMGLAARAISLDRH